MNFIRHLMGLFTVPTPALLAARELEEARRELLRSYSAQEYASSLVQYNCDRVARLERTIYREQS